jgi:hypothetical protein
VCIIFFAAGFQIGFSLVPIPFCTAIYFAAKLKELVSAALQHSIYNVDIRIAPQLKVLVALNGWVAHEY